MRTILRKLSILSGRSNESWLVLLLALVVLAPSICLLWFMNQAVQNERLAVRQKLVDAYRGHLTLAQEQLEARWKTNAAELDAEAKIIPAAMLFAQQVRAGSADALICFDAAGKIAYPDLPPQPKHEVRDAAWAQAERVEFIDPTNAAGEFARIGEGATNVDLAARALQAQARCLVRAGQKEAAISLLLGPLSEARFRTATDFEGRLVAPNAQLMALELLKGSAPEKVEPPLDRLKAELVDYETPGLSAPQRRFVMHELLRLFPDRVQFSTLMAEDLAAAVVEAQALQPAEPTLRPTRLPGVWQFASESGRVVTLHQTESLVARLRAATMSPTLPADVRVDPLVPGREREGALLSLPLGPKLPNWRLALSLKDQRLFDAATSQRVASYVWIGVLVVGVVSVLAAFALRLVRRQVALTQLRNDLVANVTHELKTPLSSMRLLVDTLLNSQPLHEQTAREYLQLIAKENVRLSRLIDNFLTFSRIERNKYAFDFNETSAASIAESAAGAVRERFQPPGCRFEVNIAPNLPSVMADADAMVTALLNLLENAWKYSGEDKQITLAASAVDGSVCFAVRDNGIGLSPRDTKRIFKRFYQVDQRLSRSGGGCGLGLSIVKFVVEAHRGNIQVESEPGRGSTFTITLPAAGSDPKEDGT